MLPPKDQMNAYKADQESRFQAQAPQGEESKHIEFGPPDLGEQPKGYNPGEVEAAYNQFDEDGLEQPYPDDEHTGQEEGLFTPPPPWAGVQDYPTPPSLREKGGGFLQEELICEGGPPVSEVNSWKKQFETDGHGIHLSTLYDEVFIWRTLSRNEYREIMALPNTDPLQREEIICEVCMLFPYDYNFTAMASRKAGIPAQIAEDIMKESGFQKAAPPIRL